jgi:hypothetical protein
VVIFGEFVLANFFKRKGICDIIFFYQIFFARWKKIQHLKNCFFQVEELEKIKLETTYPSYIGLFFLLTCDVSNFRSSGAMNVESNVLIFCWKDVKNQ